MAYVEYSKLMQSISFNLLADDCSTIKCLTQNVKDPIFAVCICPYYCLFCDSALDYFNLSQYKLLEPQIKTVRNRLKLTQKQPRKTKQVLLRINHNNDMYSKNRYNIPYFRMRNHYNNLGIYLDSNYNIIANTQMASYINNIDNMYADDISEACKKYGYNIGYYLACIIKALSRFYEFKDINLGKMVQIPYFLDINTNKNNFFNSKYSMDINLLMLYLLCDLNFINRILLPLLPINNLWGFRIRYISAHYALLGFKQLAEHLLNIDTLYSMGEITQLQSDLFKSDFRNCMMYYNINFNGRPAISINNFNENIPFYGLIETQFNGLTMDEYSALLDTIIAEMIDYLSSNFSINTNLIDRIQ